MTRRDREPASQNLSSELGAEAEQTSVVGKDGQTADGAVIVHGGNDGEDVEVSFRVEFNQ